MPTINGTAASELLDCTAEADIINGLEGNDQLVGNGGGDTLNGGDGDDWLHAGSITGEFERPFFGNNPEFVSPTLDTGAEIDTLNGGAGLDIIFSGYGDIVDGGADRANLLISLMGASSGITVDFRNLDNGGTLTIGGNSISNIQSVTWIEGSNFADVIIGSDQGSTFGLYYAPIFGRGGNDQLTAGANTGNIYGGDGNDTILAASGGGFYYGEAGDDTITTTLADTASYGGDGNDTLNVAGGIYANYGGAGNDAITATNASVALVANGDGGNDTLTGNGQGDTLRGGSGADIINGNGGGDTLYSAGDIAYTWDGYLIHHDAGAEHDELSGGDGNDWLSAGYGDDIDGGTGQNTLALSLLGASSGVTLNVADLTGGSPYMLGGGTIQNIQSVTHLWGSNHADTLTLQWSMDAYAMGGNDIVNGTDIEDRIHGGAGADTINAGDGNDFIYLDSFDDVGAGEQINGGAGTDMLIAVGAPGLPDGTYYDISGATLNGIEKLGAQVGAIISLTQAQLAGITSIATDLHFAASGAISMDGIAAELSTMFLLNEGGNQLDLTGFTPDGFCLVGGSDVADTVHGSASTDDVYANGGNDLLYGNGGGDNLQGGAGHDHLDGGADADILVGGAGNDMYIVDLQSDSVVEAADEGIDTVKSSATFTLSEHVERLQLTGSAAINGSGNELANILTGNDGANSLLGFEGNDDLYGNGGNDTLSGGIGDDRLFAGIGNDTLSGGSGYDRMYGGIGDDTYTVGDATDFAYENAGEGTDKVNSSVNHQLRANVENLTLTGSANLIGEGNDIANVITGNGGANRLYGYDGNDTLNGQGGDDYLLGGAGNDTLSGGSGYDRMYGGTGNDSYLVVDSTDYAYENGGEGTDRVIATINHQLRANVEELELAGTGDLRGYGNAGNNLILGNSGNNLLYGRDGNDVLKGNAGNDILYGENGDDMFQGGTGQDRHYGGAGADDFIFGGGDFAGMTSGTADRIHDFVSGLDQIDLSAVDANGMVPDDQQFAFIGTGAFTGAAGQLRYQQISGNTYVMGDTDGDGDADFWIRLDGLHNLQAGDFII
jgi:Ca2+-binding RTX toxin-like protein